MKSRGTIVVDFCDLSLAEIAHEQIKLEQLCEAIKQTSPNALAVQCNIDERRGDPIKDIKKFKFRTG